MKPSFDTNFAAFVGIDWADLKHDVCLQQAGSKERERSVLVHRPETIERWALSLRERFAGRPIAVCLEIAKGPLVYALQRYEFLVLFPVNPTTLANYRQTFRVSGAKDDPTDAELALELLLVHPEKLNALRAQSPAMRTLEQLGGAAACDGGRSGPPHQPPERGPQAILSAGAGMVQGQRHTSIL